MRTIGGMREMSIRVVRVVAVAAFLAAAAGGPANAAKQTQNAVAGAAQQSNQSSDLTITRNIRRALVKDKSLSVEAHNEPSSPKTAR